MVKRAYNDKINEDDEEPDDRGTFRRAMEEYLKAWEIRNAVTRNESGMGNRGFPKTTTDGNSPFSSLSKEPTQPGTSKKSGAATNFTLSATKTGTSDDGPFSGLKGFAETTAAGKSPFSFLPKMPLTGGTANISGAKSAKRVNVDNHLENTSSSKAKDPKSDGYMKKLISLNKSVAAWIKTHVDESPKAILEDYVKNLKEMDKEEDESKKFTEAEVNFWLSRGKPISTAVPSSGFSFSAKPGSTSIGGGAAGTSIFGSANFGGTKNFFSDSKSADKPSNFLSSLFNQPPAFSFTLCKPSFNFTTTKPASLLPGKCGAKSTACKIPTSGVATTTCLPRFQKGAFGTSALKRADKLSLLEGTTTSSAQETKTNVFGYGLQPDGKNWTTYSSSSTRESRFFGTKVEEKPSSTPATFGGMLLRSSENRKIENNQPIKDMEEFKQVVEEDAVYSKKCRVFIKIGKNYADQGICILHLLPLKANGKTQLTLRADTDLRNVLVNFVLCKETSTQRIVKNNLVMVSTSSQTKKAIILLCVKTGEEADELLATLEKYKK